MSRPGDPRVPARDLVAAAFALPPLALVLLALVLAFGGGSVTTGQWVPYAVGVVAALSTLAVVGAMPAVPRVALPSLVALGGLIGWSAVSIFWSQSQDATMAAVARLALVGAAYVVGAVFLARARPALLVSAAVSVASTILAFAVLVRLGGADLTIFRASRLSWPVTYANGTAAVVFIGVPGALVFGSAAPLRPLVRGLAIGAATLMLAVGLVAQSRGGALALIVALAATVLASRDRHRASLMLLAVILPVAMIARRLVSAAAPTESSARSVAVAIVLAVAVTIVLATGLAMLDRRNAPPFGTRGPRIAPGVWLAIMVLGAVGFSIRAGNPISWVQDRWTEFSDVGSLVSSTDASRFGSGQSNRYDYMRVGLDAGVGHPIHGVGAGAFAVPWAAKRRVSEYVDDAHSWPIGTFAELGVVGVILIGVVLLLPFRGARRARNAAGAWPVVGAALTGQAAYFVSHAAVDWLLRIPPSALVGMLVLGALGSAGVDDGRRRLAGRTQRVAFGTIGAIAVAFAIPSYLGARLLYQAEGQAVVDPRAAIGTLVDAARVNPFTPVPLEEKASILLQLGDIDGALAAARAGTRRAPDDWVAWLSYVQVTNAAGKPDAVAIDRLARLNPRRVSP